MAVDEALLDTAADSGVATLRFYRWDAPTLSLGYFQAYGDRDRHEPSRPCPAVRRSTGGGALMHDAELTYSLALPPGNQHVRDATALTCLAHRALVSAVADLGGDAERLTTCAAAIPAAGGAEPFLCFLRRAVGDLLMQWASAESTTGDRRDKVCGSAQRRRRGALLQHGGALMAKSEHAPELSGLIDGGVLLGLCAAPDGYERLQQAWATRIAEAMGLTLEPAELSPAEHAAAESLATERFAAETWTRRR